MTEQERLVTAFFHQSRSASKKKSSPAQERLNEAVRRKVEEDAGRHP